MDRSRDGYCEVGVSHHSRNLRVRIAHRLYHFGRSVFERRLYAAVRGQRVIYSRSRSPEI